MAQQPDGGSAKDKAIQSMAKSRAGLESDIRMLEQYKKEAAMRPQGDPFYTFPEWKEMRQQMPHLPKLADGGSTTDIDAMKLALMNKVLPRHEADANLAKFLEGAASKDRMYHATGDDFQEIDPSKSSPEGKFGSGFYMTPQTRYANFFASVRGKQGKNAQIMPVHTSIKNPYKIHGHANIPFNKPDQKKLQSLGHDGIFYYDDHGDLKEAIAFHPTQVKSAIGNRGTYDTNEADINKADGGVAHMAGGGNMSPQYPTIQEMLQKLQEAGRTPIVPAPNRWFHDPVKHPYQQKMIERVLAQTGQGREGFPSGSYINPQTGEPMDFDIMHDLGVAIDPVTGRPMMSGIKSNLTSIDPKYGSITKSNLVRKGLFKHEGGDELLKNLAFLATIEKSGKGHHYGLSTHYASPAELVNTMTGQNPTLRPHSRGDIYGVGDEVGRISIQGKHHPVYEKLMVAPAGSDVQGRKLHKAKGGTVKDYITITERPL